MRHFDNLVVAINSLKKEGYTYDFKLRKDRIRCEELDKEYKPQSFEVEDVIHFEGDDSSPNTRSTMFVIATTSGEKGILIDEDGIYGADNISEELLEKLKQR